MPLAQPSRKESLNGFGESIKAFLSSRIAVALATVILGSLIVASALLPQSVALEKGQFAKRGHSGPKDDSEPCCHRETSGRGSKGVLEERSQLPRQL